MRRVQLTECLHALRMMSVRGKCHFPQEGECMLGIRFPSFFFFFGGLEIFYQMDFSFALCTFSGI